MNIPRPTIRAIDAGARVWWGVPLIALAALVAWEMQRGKALDARLAAPPAVIADSVVVALLPEYRLAGEAAALDQTVSRPLFTPTRKPAPPPGAAAPQMPVRRYLLLGTTLSQEGRFAFLKDAAGPRSRLVRKGDQIDGVMVVEIEPDRVRLAAGGQAEEVLLKGFSGQRPAAPAAPVQAVASAIAPVARAPPPNPPEAAIPSRHPQGESARGDEASDNE